MNVESLTNFISFSRLQFSPSELSSDSHLAIAGNNHLVIILRATDRPKEETSDGGDTSSIVLEFDADAGRPTTLSWIEANVLCVGFESGLLSCSNTAGEELFIFRGGSSAVRALRTTLEKDAVRLWCLYEEGLIVSISLKHARAGKFSEAVGFKLCSQSAVDDFVLYVKCAGHGTSLFDDGAKDELRAMVVGADSAVGIYDLSTAPSNAVEEVGRNKEKSSSFSRSLYSIFSVMSGYSDVKKTAEEEYTWSRSKMFSSNSLLALNDEKRRVFRITVDPYGCVAATADSLGRVILYDLRSEIAVRMWKGLRDARLGWVADNESMLLAIYAPQLGLVSLYKMLHGPCQRVIAVGLGLSMACTPMLRLNLPPSMRDGGTSSRNLVLKYNSDKSTLETIPIEAGAFSDSELEQVARFVKEHQGSGGAASATAWEESLRSSDMHASIQEVIEREQRLRRSALHSSKELSRLLHDWATLVHSKESRQSLEQSILHLLSRPMSLRSVVAIVAAIEYTELTGAVLEFAASSTDEVYLPVPAGSWQLRGNSPKVSFSAEFHRSIVDRLGQCIKEDDGDASLLVELQQEVEFRVKLLNAIALLDSIQRQGDDSAPGALSAMQRDDTAQICKQSSFRAEALCWTLRSIKRLSGSSDTPPTRTSPPLTSSSTLTVSPTPSLSTVSPVLSIGSPKRIVRMMTPTGRVLSTDVDSVTSVPKRVASSVNVSVLRACFRQTKGGQCCLRTEDLRCAQQADHEFIEVQGFLSIAQRVAVDVVGHHGGGAWTATISLHLVTSQATEAAELLFRALLGDLVSLHTYVAALKVLGLHSASALRHILPLVIQFLCSQSLQTLVAEFLTKKMSVSPLQRWLRDHLLTFQDSFSSFLARNKTKPSDSLEAEEEEASTDGQRAKSESLGEDYAPLEELERSILEDLREHTTDGRLPPSHPVFDQCARYLFRPAWLQCRDASNLEAVLAFAAALLETMYTVNDQVERRTYGQDNLKRSLLSWENLVRHVRVLLFVRNRIYDHKTYDAAHSTVSNLSEGKLSIFRILAKDTLVFAMRAEQAKEHEHQCLEVYRRRMQEAAASEAASSQAADGAATTAAAARAGQAEVLLAWGKVADKRWRDIITIAMNEDTVDRLAGEQSQQRRRRKPLLLYFPDHNNLEVLGAYRSILLAEKWADRIDKMETLALVCEHLFDLSMSWRAVVALHIYTQHLLPVVQMLVDLEEDQAFAMSPDRRKQLLNLMGESALMHAFVRSGEEILGFVVEGRTASAVSLLQTVAFHVEQFKRYLSKQAFRDEKDQAIWPVPTDNALSQLFLSYYRDFVLEDGDTVAASLAKDRCVIEEAEEGSSFEQWTADALAFQRTVLSVLQLRFQCGLRGVKPSQLLGPVVRDMVALNNPSVGRPLDWQQMRKAAEQDLGTTQARFEFIEQGLRRLVATQVQGQTAVAMSLSAQWGFSRDLTRLLLMKALLEPAGPISSRDEELEHMIPQFENKDLVVDALISIVRFRLGGLLLSLERHAATHGALLASLDSEAAAWVRLSVNTHKTCTIAPIAFKSEDLSSSRQLIIYVQGLLLAVPVNLRKQAVSDFGWADETLSPAMKARLEGGLALSRYSTWLEQKTRCDALLNLCNTLMQAVQTAAAAIARKK